jgi:hypothetical protein
MKYCLTSKVQKKRNLWTLPGNPELWGEISKRSGFFFTMT